MNRSCSPQAPEADCGACGFRAVMRAVVGNVSIITAGIGDDRSGLVATSMVSLSIDPPTILACVNRSSSTWPVIARYRHLGVSCLAAHHEAIAERFSGFDGTSGVDRFDGAEWFALRTGAWLLRGANAVLDCTVEEMLDRGSHSIVIGAVAAARTSDANDALVYWKNGYRALCV